MSSFVSPMFNLAACRDCRLMLGLPNTSNDGLDGFVECELWFPTPTSAPMQDDVPETPITIAANYHYFNKQDIPSRGTGGGGGRSPTTEPITHRIRKHQICADFIGSCGVRGNRLVEIHVLSRTSQKVIRNTKAHRLTTARNSLQTNSEIRRPVRDAS